MSDRPIRRVPLVSTKDLCDYFGVSRQAVEQWRKKGCPVVVNNLDGTKRYHLKKVIRWINKRKRIRKIKGKREYIPKGGKKLNTNK